MSKRFLHLGCFLGLTLLSTAQLSAAPVREFADLDAALQAARRSKPLRGGVSPSIGEAAAEKIQNATTGALIPLARVAGAGGAGARAGDALLERYFEGEREQACLVAVLELPSALGNAALAKEQQALAESAQEAGASTVVLKAFGRVATSSKIRGTLESWSRAEDRGQALTTLLAALGEHHRPTKLFRSLLQAHDLRQAEAKLCGTLSALIKRDAGVRKRALSILATSKRPDRVAASLAMAGEGRSKAVRAALEKSLAKPATAPNALAGILATRTCRPQALERVVALTKDSKAGPAALRALPRLLSYCKKATKEQRAAADRAIGAALASETPEVLVAAVNAGRQLRHPALLNRLAALTRHGKSEVRLAAIRAVPRAMKLNASSVDLLMARFDDSDPAVANLAWKTLQHWAKVSIPLNRRGLWQSWRERKY
jgi:hypothetical protein